MKVSVCNLRANPFRDYALYPTDPDRVEALKLSIRSTGFWDNFLARDIQGSYQIVYGHHRLRALKELVFERIIEPGFIIDLQHRRIDDATMIRIMCQESCEAVLHAVSVTRRFLHKETGTPLKEILAEDICQFLGGAWHRDKPKVRKALKQLSEMQGGQANAAAWRRWGES